MEGEKVDSQKSDEQKSTEREAIPGTPIVRGNTPRPFMYNTMTTIPPSQLPQEQFSQDAHGAFSTLSAFPTKPPSAPPLPEEPDDYGEQSGRLSPGKVIGPEEAQAFAWLFEYGIEMDSTLLNTPERLDGLALLYGPGVLKGYRLLVGSHQTADYSERTVATIVPDTHPDAEVWGVLYRVPQHVVQPRGDEPALSDIVHVQPQSSARAMHVVVQETYRNRTLACITYGWRDVSPLQSTSAKNYDGLDVYIRRLTSIAKKQRLPDTYSKSLAHLGSIASIPDTPSTQHTQREVLSQTAVSVISKSEQQTEPLVLPITKLEKPVRSQETSAPGSQVQRVPIKAYPQRWFVAFALYLFILLLAILAFAIVQGVGIANDVLNDHFTLLSVPWLVLIYGLLGGCISSIVTLGRITQPIDAPVFVVITWFTRPFVGVVLALFAYLLLNSGIFLPTSTSTSGQHQALFLLIGALAGVCEGWLFLRK